MMATPMSMGPWPPQIPSVAGVFVEGPVGFACYLRIRGYALYKRLRCFCLIPCFSLSTEGSWKVLFGR